MKSYAVRFAFILTAAVVVTIASSHRSAAAANALANVSLLAQSGTRDSAIQLSFTIEGTTAKTILVRAKGPSLSGFGVAGAMADPLLSVYDGAGVVVASNDDWGGTTALADAFRAVGAFSCANTSKDAALLAALNPGTYTARIMGANGTSGDALPEVYDTDGTQRVADVAARVSDGTGGTASFGFVVAGPAAQTVLVRALGPALGGVDGTGVLADPTLRSLTGSTTLGTNDNWSEDPVASAASSAGLMPLVAGTRDAALVATLPPGASTATVSGADNGTGVALVEVS